MHLINWLFCSVLCVFFGFVWKIESLGRSQVVVIKKRTVTDSGESQAYIKVVGIAIKKCKKRGCITI